MIDHILFHFDAHMRERRSENRTTTTVKHDLRMRTNPYTQKRNQNINKAHAHTSGTRARSSVKILHWNSNLWAKEMKSVILPCTQHCHLSAVSAFVLTSDFVWSKRDLLFMKSTHLDRKIWNSDVILFIFKNLLSTLFSTTFSRWSDYHLLVSSEIISPKLGT